MEMEMFLVQDVGVGRQAKGCVLRESGCTRMGLGGVEGRPLCSKSRGKKEGRVEGRARAELRPL